MANLIFRKFDMSWGNSIAVRSAFLDNINGRPIVFGLKELEEMNYPPHEGDHRLIEVTRHVIERQVGPTFNNILLTNGATGAATVAMRAFQHQGYNVAFTRSPPYFPLYPGMIKAAGLTHRTEADNRPEEEKPVALIDSPTNPEGLIIEGRYIGMPTIWDGVYHSKVYTYGNYKPMHCEVLVGSYSKLLGINGLRTGWLATNDDLLYLRAKELVTSEYCGISSASTHILLDMLSDFKDNRWWDQFEWSARYNLDYNRGEWSKLERFFGGQAVSYNGMFYYSLLDSAARKLFTKSNVIWTPGSSLGASDEFARFNLGQDCKLVRDAVKEILKNDRI